MAPYRLLRSLFRLPGLIAALTLATACTASDPNRQSGIARLGQDPLDSLWPVGTGVDDGFVPAGEVFRASGVAIWNGQRTVRGIWVAHPRADRTRQVRIVNSETGTEIDGVLYRAERSSTAEQLTLSSEAARALGLRPGQPGRISVTGLRPRGETSQQQRRTVQTRAETELASHIARLDDTQLVQVAAAAMRGMGYATIFEEALLPGLLSGIRAFPRPDRGHSLPAIRVITRPISAAPMGVDELRQIQDRLTGSGDLGAVLSVSGYTQGIRTAIAPDGAHVELLDRDGLMTLWTTYYEQLSEPDRALLPLEPIYFLARQ